MTKKAQGEALVRIVNEGVRTGEGRIIQVVNETNKVGESKAPQTD